MADYVSKYLKKEKDEEKKNTSGQTDYVGKYVFENQKKNAYSVISDSQDYLRSLAERATNSDFDSARSYAKSAKDNDINRRVQQTRAWVQSNKDRLGDDYDRYMTYLNGYGENASAYDKYLSNRQKYYSQFADEGEYNRALKEQTYRDKYSGKSYADLMANYDKADANEKAWIDKNKEAFMTDDDMRKEIEAYGDTGVLQRYGNAIAKLIGNIHYDNNGNLVRDKNENAEKAVDDYSRIERYKTILADNEARKSVEEAVKDSETAEILSRYYGGVQNSDRAYNFNFGGSGGAISADTGRTAGEVEKAQALKELEAKGYSADEAKKLAEDYVRISDKNFQEYLNEQQYEFAKDYAESARDIYGDKVGGIVSGIAGATGSTLGKFVTMPSSLADTARDLLNGNEVNPYSTGHIGQNLARQTDEAIQGTYDWNVGGMDLYDFGYGVLESVEDNLLRALVTGGNATAIGGLMSAEVFDQAIVDGKLEGKSNSTALADAIVQAAIEGITEKYSMEYVLKPDKAKSVIGGIVKSMLSEGSEEVASDALNDIYDNLVNGKYSEIQTKVRDYLAEGYSQEEASTLAFKDVMSQYVQDGLAGAVSGGILGGGVAVDAGQSLVDRGLTGVSNAVSDTVNANNLANNDVLRSLAESKASAELGEYERLVENADDSRKSKGAIKKAAKNVVKQTRKNISAEERNIMDTKVAESIKEDTENEYSEQDRMKAYKLWADGKTIAPYYQKVLSSMNGFEDAVKSANTAINEQAEERTFKAIENATRKKSAADTSGFNKGGNGTTVEYNGENATIKNIDGGNVVLSNGETVDYADVKMSDAMATVVVQTEELAKAYKLNSAQTESIISDAETIIEANPDANADYVMFAIEDAMKYGSTGFENGFKNGTFTSLFKGNEIAQSVLQRVYNEANSKRESVTQRKNKGKGTTSYIGEAEKSLNKDNTRKVQADYVSKVVNEMGVNLVFGESKNIDGKFVMIDENGNEHTENGNYDAKTNTIYIDINSGNLGTGLIIFTAAHELTHAIRANNSKGFNTFADYLLSHYSEGKLNALMRAKANALGLDMQKDYDTIYEEVVADSCERFLLDGNLAERLTELKNTDTSLFNKIKNYIQKLIDAFKALKNDIGVQNLVNEHKEADIVAKFEDYDKLINLWEDALIGASQGDGNVANGYVSISKEYSGIPSAQTNIVDSPVMSSVRTYEEAMPKYIMPLADGTPKMLDVLKTTRQVLIETARKENKDIKAIVKDLDNASKMMKRMGLKYRFVNLDDVNNASITYDADTGRYIFSAMVKNGEYPVNFDFTTICKKRDAAGKFIEKIITTKDENGRYITKNYPITENNLALLNEALRESGYETACLGCFVETKRYDALTWAAAIVNDYNDAVERVNPNAEWMFGEGYDVDIKDLDIEKAEKLLKDKQKVKGKNTATGRITQYIENTPSMQKKIKVSDLLTAEGIRNIASVSPELLSFVKTRYGQATPKLTQGFTPYNSEIALLPESKRTGDGTITTADYLFKIAGARGQSFSDFKIEYFFDYMQMFADAMARGFPMHLYTKEISFAKLFGMMGAKINLSVMHNVMPVDYWEQYEDMLGEKASVLAEKYAGMYVDENGNIANLTADKKMAQYFLDKFNKVMPVQSIGYDDAVSLQNQKGYNGNVGIIGVGYSTEQVRALLRDKNMRYVIPYHKSSLPKVLANATNLKLARDFTSVQNTLEVTSITDNGKTYDSLDEWLTAKNHFDINSKNAIDIVNEINKGVENGTITVSHKTAEAGHGKFNLYDSLKETNDPKETVNRYVADCLNNGKLPLFYEFANEENYYKVHYDFAVYDTNEKYAPQEAVGWNLPENYEQMVEEYMSDADRYNERQFGYDTMENTLKTWMQKVDESRVKKSERFSSSSNPTAEDNEYLKAVESGDTDKAQKLVEKAAMDWGAYADKDGKPKVFHHGTFGKFTTFDNELIGTAREGDVGFFGKGFYFAFSEGEARMYGKNLISAYLQMKNPFNYEKELGTYKGQRGGSMGVSDAAFVLNLVEKFPELASHHKITVGYKGWDSDSLKEISFKKFAEEFDKVYNNKKFKVQEVDGEYGKEWLVLADREKHSFVGSDGKQHEYVDYGFQQRFVNEDEAKSKLEQTYAYLYRNVFSYLSIPLSTDIIQEVEFSKALQDRGYDSLIQSEYGDEAVVYSAEQIKSADAITYDDDGNVIPLSKRFSNSEDIRYSERFSPSSNPTKEDNEYLEAINNGDMEKAKSMVEKAARRAGFNSPKLFHGTSTFGWTKPMLRTGENTKGGELGLWTAADVESVRYYSGEAENVREIGHGNTEEEIADTNWWRETWKSHGINGEDDVIYADGIYQLYGNTDGFLDVKPEDYHNDYFDIQFNGKHYNTVSLAQYAKDNGYKGLHIDGVLDGNVFSDEYIFFEPWDQVKSADTITYDNEGNVIPLSERFNKENADIRYSTRDSAYLSAVESGNTEEAQRMVDQAAMDWGAIKDKGKPKVFYHGTDADFTEFLEEKIGSNAGLGMGVGFYFSSDKGGNGEMSAATYGDRIMEAYLKVQNPLTFNKKTIDRDKFVETLHRMDYKHGIYHKWLYESLYDEASSDGQLYSMFNDRALESNDIRLTHKEIVSAFESFGFDGVMAEVGKNSTHIVVFSPNQIKSADTITYDNDGNVIPLSERFSESKDIRYSARGDASVTEDYAENVGIDLKFSERVTDKKLLDFLNRQEKDGDVIHTYKTMQIVDGKLYSPMAAMVKGEDGKYEWTPPNTLGVWQRSVEDTSNIKLMKKRKKATPSNLPLDAGDYGVYTLKKGKGKEGGTPIDAAYNPYEHSSNLVLNDQFESANKRPNLVTVECIIPKSEITNPYHAKYAKDTTGELDWHTGEVAGSLPRGSRKVYLSRYLKPIRILDDSEVAQMYKETLSGYDVSVPFNVVSPSLLKELENVGVPINYSGTAQYRKRNADTESQVKKSERITPEQYDEMKEHFGTTNNFKFAGYMLEDGTMLDFSGKHWGDSSPSGRYVDHRDIQEVLPSKQNGVDSMIRMLNNGNIRIMPETSGINIITKPSKTQLSRLRTYFDTIRFANRDEDIVVDIDDENGKTIHSFVYANRTPASRVVNDIINYFDNGTVPSADTRSGNTNISDFLFSERDQTFGEVNAALRKDYEELKRLVDVQNMQTTGNKGLPSRTAIEKVASSLMQRYGVRQGKGAIADMLQSFYDSYFKKDFVASESMSLADRVAKEIVERSEKYGITDEGQEVLDYLKGAKIKLTDTQKQEIISQYGSLKAFRDKFMSRMVFNDSGVDFDSWWKEASEVMPYIFDENVSEGDMPSALVDILESAKEPQLLTSADGMQGVIADEVYDSAWDILTHPTTADKSQKEIRQLKENHKKAMAEIRAKRDEKIKEIRRQNMESRHNAVVKRQNTVSRNRIKKFYSAMATKLYTNSKTKRIPDMYKPYVKELLKAVDGTGARIDNEFLSQIKGGMDTESVLANLIEQVRDIGKPLSEMSADELSLVYRTARAVMSAVQQYDEAIIDGRKVSVDTSARAVVSEIIKITKREGVASGTMRQYLWSLLDPYRAFDVVGSSTLMKFFEEARKGDDTMALDMLENSKFTKELAKKYNTQKWNMKELHEVEFTDFTPSEENDDIANPNKRKVKMTIGELMSLYALSKREQAQGHLEVGGIKLYDEIREGVRKTARSTIRGLSLDEINAVCKKNLTDNQRAYVDEAVEYMSTVMAKKGNEVSQYLYQIDLFGEKYYFPIQVSGDYTANETVTDLSQKNTGDNFRRLKNIGFTKEVTPNASNPILVKDFTQVFTEHCSQMAMYHSYAIGIDNLEKVIMRKVNGQYSVRDTIESRHGNAAKQYMMSFLKDVNGGRVAERDSIMSIMSNLFGKMKKTAVGYSLSTVIQQPTAIVRAMAMINPVDFVYQNINHAKTWEELKKHCPVAINKEMGGFDIGYAMNNAKDMMDDINKGNRYEKIMKAIDDVGMWGAAKGDELGWNMIWNAVKHETKRLHPNVSQEEFWDICSKRFTDVVTQTQVYDSVFTRSDIMRSKNPLAKLSTAFMGEPTKILNMYVQAVNDFRRGKTSKLKAMTTMCTVLMSSILAAVAKSIPYAFRDDDDEKELDEKYINKLLYSLADELNPINLLPYVRDMWATLVGNSNERGDLSVINEFVNSYKALSYSNRSAWRKAEDFGGAIAKLFGLPAKNISREIRSVFNLFKSVADGKVVGGIDNDMLKSALIENIPDLPLDFDKKIKDYFKVSASNGVRRIEKGNLEKGKEILKQMYDAEYEKAIADNPDTEKAKKTARQKVREAISKVYRDEYKEACRNNDATTKSDIRKILSYTGYFDDLDKTLAKWEKDS